jgi:hypothetical protein
MSLTAHTITGGEMLPIPHQLNGGAVTPCGRPDCTAVKKHMFALLQQMEALTTERDALRELLEGVADWMPLGGERVARALTGTERRIAEALLKAGLDERGDYRVVRHERLLSLVWGLDYSDEYHLLRVNVSRIRQKLRLHDWDVLNAPGFGYRMARYERGQRRANARVTEDEAAEMRRLLANGLNIKQVALKLRRSPETVGRMCHAPATGAGGES